MCICTFVRLSVFLAFTPRKKHILLSLSFPSFCLTVSFCAGLRASSSLPASPRQEWWFRAYCEVSNPIQSQPESKGGRDGGEARVRGWETKGIMGVLIARSMLSGAQGDLAPLPALCFTCCSHSLVCPLSFPHPKPKLFIVPFCALCLWPVFFNTYVRPSSLSLRLPSLQTYGIVSDFIRKMIWSVSRLGMKEQLVTFETFNSCSLSVFGAAVTPNNRPHIESPSRWPVCVWCGIPICLVHVF